MVVWSQIRAKRFYHLKETELNPKPTFKKETFDVEINQLLNFFLGLYAFVFSVSVTFSGYHSFLQFQVVLFLVQTCGPDQAWRRVREKHPSRVAFMERRPFDMLKFNTNSILWVKLATKNMLQNWCCTYACLILNGISHNNDLSHQCRHSYISISKFVDFFLMFQHSGPDVAPYTRWSINLSRLTQNWNQIWPHFATEAKKRTSLKKTKKTYLIGKSN